MTRRPSTRALLLIALLLPGAPAGAQQVADTAFDVSVPRPAHTKRRPVVMIDEAHRNFHTAEGRYAPLAQLLRNDGYEVVRGTQETRSTALQGVDVFVTSNAVAGDGDRATSYAFTEAEADALRDWVRAGGSLLLVADHAPFGGATENLARRFGVEFGKGFVYDSTAALPGSGAALLVFADTNGLLGDHAIVRGRDSTERVRTVFAFTGQSMTVPAGATALLRLSPNAREGQTRDDVLSRRGVPVGGRAQGIALPFGRGRVIILGEAAMLSAQIARRQRDGQQQEFRMGMNFPGSDDKQFTLNVFRWLSGALK